MLFTQCNYLMDKNGALVVVVPTRLPKDDTIMLEIHKNGVIFRHGDEELAHLPLPQDKTIHALVNRGRVGIIECEKGNETFPAYITAIANIEVMREAA